MPRIVLFHTHFGYLRMVSDPFTNHSAGTRYAGFVDDFGNYFNLLLSEVYVTLD